MMMRARRRNTWSGLATATGLAVLAATVTEAAEPGYYQQPALHENRLVFVSEGDLWTATLPPFGSPEATNPIIAHRLTATDGSESRPVFDTSGTRIAFASEAGGNLDVYVMPVDGGAPTRLTWHPDRDVPYTWTPDGSQVVFGSPRAHPHGRLEAWRVPVTGGLPERDALGECSAIALSSTGRRIAFTPWSNETWNWKGYRGGTAPDIWVGEPQAGVFTQFTDDDANDMHPMWVQGRIYFLSDRSGAFNLFSDREQGGDLRQHTRFGFNPAAPTALEGYDMRWPAAGSERRTGTIVFCQAGGLVRFDVGSERIERLDVRIASDRVAARARFADVATTLGEVAVSPDGSAIVLGTRGELLRVETASRDVSQLTNSASTREWGVTWLGEQDLAMVSDLNGEQQIAVIPDDGLEGPSLATDDRAIWLMPPQTSPDGRWIAFADGAMELHVVDMDTLERTPVDKATAGEITEYRFSPDAQWIAYEKPQPNELSSIMLYSLRTKRTFEVSDGMSADRQPRWDPAGNFLYFLSDRHFDPVVGRFEMQFVHPSPTLVVAVPLSEDTPPPIAASMRAAEFDMEAWATPKELDRVGDVGGTAANDPIAAPLTDDLDDEDIVPLRVDTEGIGRRQAILRIPPGRYDGLEGTWGGVALVSSPVTGLLTGDDWGKAGLEPGDGRLMRFTVADEELTLVAAGVDHYAISRDRQTLVHPGGAGLVVHRLGSGEPTVIGLDGMRVAVEARQEWNHVFDEAWRLQRDFFWAPNYVGVDWEAMRNKYRVLLPRIGSREELNLLIGEMLGELGTSHTYLFGGDRNEHEIAESISVGLLGIDLVGDGRGYRIERILPAFAWSRELESPLAGAHLDVAEGDFLVGINGIPIDRMVNPYAPLQDRAGKIVNVIVADTDDGANRRSIRVRALASERPLRYQAWVAANRAAVDEASGGTIGYLHIPDMGGEGLAQFSRQFYPQFQKRAFVIDVRDNGGGFVSQMILERFAREVIAFAQPRYGVTGRYPSRAPNAHMVVLIDQHAGSDGDIFPAAFRMRGLGMLIGTRTWGGTVGIRGDKPFLDMGMSTQPEFAWWDSRGWSIENQGVVPDIEVAITPADRMSARDPQLERAIEELKAMLADDPMDLPPVPPYPVRRPR